MGRDTDPPVLVLCDIEDMLSVTLTALNIMEKFSQVQRKVRSVICNNAIITMCGGCSCSEKPSHYKNFLSRNIPGVTQYLCTDNYRHQLSQEIKDVENLKCSDSQDFCLITLIDVAKT